MADEEKASGAAVDYLDVLPLCAAPIDVRPALNLAVEVADFEAEVRRSPVPIRLRRVFTPTFEQLQRELSAPALQNRTPRVFHVLGHGEEEYLWFEDEESSGDKVTAARLRRLFEGTPIQLALLNACQSATLRVKSLCGHLVEGTGLAAAIGHGKPVADVSAPGGGVFLLRNSWGKAWAAKSRYKSGYGTLFFEYVRQYDVEAYF
jgi:hypothetical protein